MIYKTTPYKHQDETTRRFQHAKYGAIFAEQGLGKSKILLDIVANSQTKRVLVLAPNGLHANWFHKEIPQHLTNSENWLQWYWKGTPARRSNNAWRLAEFLKSDDEKKLLLVNVEAIRTNAGFDTAYAFLKGQKDTMIVIDESTCIKNPKAQVTKACWKLAALADRRFILTGTPMTQGPLDIFAQVKFLDENATPYRTWTSFKNAFAIEETKHFGMRAVKVVSGYRNLERLTEVMKPFSVRLTKDDCLDLPDKLWQRHYVDMTKEQKRAYEELRDTALTILGSGEEVSSTIPLTTILKLQQICSGFVKDDEGTVVKIPCEKLDALMQIAKNAQPLVIFCAFRENVRILRDALTDAFGPDSCSLYMGGMNNDQRTEAVQRFKSGISKFFLATSAGAKGLTLTEASTLVYYSCDYKLETRLQSQDRIHRIGQSKKCTYIDLVCPGSIEEKILLALDGKKQLSDMVLEELVELIRNS